ncbi:hypothetical protein HN954_03105 [bacterium]|jgi:hypothetical protein|nr:hypothetical protein [bacterium]MBT6832161.1 hypothetical protein [bacterium]MBT6996393.1 hypothetical protein [bacterium]MBT7772128.1 hypothetical protein [bacterium]
MKYKNAGVSLAVSMIVSFLVLGLSVEIMRLVSKSFDQTQNLVRGNQVFYGAEGGLEAAFFHHNSRGQGVQFDGTDASQTIAQADPELSVSWKIDGRADSISGNLRENQTVQIPFFWDGAANVGEAATIERIPSSDNFTLEIGDASGLDFNSNPDVVIATWDLKRATIVSDEISKVETFTPTSSDAENPCAGNFGSEHSFVCAGDIFSTSISISSNDSNLPGAVLPGKMSSDLSTFFVGTSGTHNYLLSIRAVGSFDKTGEGKIQNLPFLLSAAGLEFPKTEYTASATVTAGNFEKTIRVTIPERTTMGMFDSVIFD